MSKAPVCRGNEDGDNAGGPCDFQPVIDAVGGDVSSDEEFVSRKSSKNKWKDDPHHWKHTGRRDPRWAKASVPAVGGASQRNGSDYGSGWSGTSNGHDNGRKGSGNNRTDSKKGSKDNSTNTSNSNNSNGNSNSNNSNGNSNSNSNSNNDNNKAAVTDMKDRYKALAANNFGWGDAPPIPVIVPPTAASSASSTANGSGGSAASSSRGTSPAKARVTPSASTSTKQRRSELRCVYCDTLFVQPKNDKPYEFPAPDGDSSVASKGEVLVWADKDDDDDDDDF